MERDSSIIQPTTHACPFRMTRKMGSYKSVQCALTLKQVSGLSNMHSSCINIGDRGSSELEF